MEKKNYVNKEIYELSYSMRREKNRRTRNIILIILLFFITMNAILIFCASPIKQQSHSMEPTIASNSFSLSTPISLYEDSQIRRGEIVIVNRQKDDSLPIAKKALNIICKALTFQKVHPFEQGDSFLSRIAAVPGDTIFMKDFVLYVMPRDERFSYTEFELSKIPYSVDIRVPPAGWSTQIGVRGDFDKITLGKDEYFVLADNRLSSMDSRIFGALDKSCIKRKIFLTYFPFKALKLFRSKIKN